MYYRPIVHIHQSSSDVPELSIVGGYEREVQSAVEATYKLKPIHVLVGLDELVDIPIIHPFRDHREMAIPHYYS